LILLVERPEEQLADKNLHPTILKSFLNRSNSVKIGWFTKLVHILCFLQTSLEDRLFFQDQLQDHNNGTNLPSAYYSHSFTGLYFNRIAFYVYIFMSVTVLYEIAIGL